MPSTHCTEELDQYTREIPYGSDSIGFFKPSLSCNFCTDSLSDCSDFTLRDCSRLVLLHHCTVYRYEKWYCEQGTRNNFKKNIY